MTTTPLEITVAVGLAAVLDWTIREPPTDYHPVALFGRVVEHVEHAGDASSKLAGTAIAVGLSLGATLVVYVGLRFVAELPATGTGVVVAILAGVVLWSTSSLRLLLEVAEQIIEDSDDDVESAREMLPALVGRCVDDLSPELIRSAAVESLAENFSDGLVAPLFAFGVLSVVSLPAAAAGATFVKAVNTLDSMLGYPGDVGWASARLDDAVMFVPARLSAILLGFAAGDPDAPLRARRYADVPASPNAGWPMGAIAAALNVRLEKPGAYVLNEVADYPTVEAGRRGLGATRRAGLASYGLVATLGVIAWI